MNKPLTILDALVQPMEQRFIAKMAAKKAQERTWSIITDPRGDDYAVRCDQDGVLENEEPMPMKQAEALLERLEEGEEC